MADPRISIKIGREWEQVLRVIASELGFSYNSQPSITRLIEAIASKEVVILPQLDAISLPYSNFQSTYHSISHGRDIYFGLNEDGKIIYINSYSNLKKLINEPKLLEWLKQRGVKTLAYCKTDSAQLESIVSELISLIKPCLNGEVESDKFQIIIDNRLKESLVEIIGNDDITNFLRSIATKEIKIHLEFSQFEQQSLIRAIHALIDRDNIEDSKVLSDLLLKSNAPDPIKAEVRRLSEIQIEWIKQVAEFIENKQPFILKTQNNSYECLFAEFSNADIAEGHRYLVAWVQDPGNSDEPEELKHNRIFRLDRNLSVESLPDAQWRSRGLDTIDVVLEFLPGFRYTPSSEDLNVFVNPTSNRLQVTKQINSVFFLFQKIRRYSDRCIVLSPQNVRDRAVQELKSSLDNYLL